MKLRWKLWNMSEGAPPSYAIKQTVGWMVLQVQEETRGAYIRTDGAYESFIEKTWVDVLLEVSV